MTKGIYFTILILLLLVTACSKEESLAPNYATPAVAVEASYTVLKAEDIIYAEGLALGPSSELAFAIPLKLDLYYPDNNAANRPALLFIHGGGFTGGVKHKPEIVEMAHYYASRGWVFVSIDYRTTQQLGTIQGMSSEEVLGYYHGLAPQEWILHALEGAKTLVKCNKPPRCISHKEMQKPPCDGSWLMQKPITSILIILRWVGPLQARLLQLH